jgi:hypothetical protein
MARYPNYPSTPFTGDLPSMAAMGPPELLPSSGTAPYYQQRIDQQYSRRLGGLGAEVQDEAVEPAWATNELAAMSELDDSQGDGVFDPPGTSPNVHSQSGVFGGRYGLPGYLARERMYSASEVKDVATGRPLIYVNAGAVAADTRAQVAFIERNLHQPVTGILNAARKQRVRPIDTSLVVQAPVPISTSGLGAAPSATKLLLLAGITAFVAGGVYALVRSRKGK